MIRTPSQPSSTIHSNNDQRNNLEVGKDGLGKGSHNLSIVMGNDTLEKGNGSLNLLLGEESEDSKHGKTSVIDFLDESSSLGLLGTVLVPSEGIVEVERSSGDDGCVEGGEFSDLSSAHVMLLGVALAPLWWISGWERMVNDLV